VRLLATSQEPLTVPSLDDPAEEPEAVALFADQARRADARFELDRESSQAATQLDGMPLAIELATVDPGRCPRPPRLPPPAISFAGHERPRPVACVSRQALA
jgi:hypothetical protein